MSVRACVGKEVYVHLCVGMSRVDSDKHTSCVYMCVYVHTYDACAYNLANFERACKHVCMYVCMYVSVDE